MSNNKSGGSGLLVGILGFSVVFGNIFLFSGDFGSGNGIITVMVLIAAAADLAVVVGIIYACIKYAKDRREEKEKNRIGNVILKVNKLLEHYSPKETISLQIPQHIDVSKSLVNTEVVYTVNHFKELVRDDVLMCSKTDQAIKKILACSDCKNADEALEYLSAKEKELEWLKSESDRICDRIASHKIKLLYEDGELMYLVKSSMNALLSSKKCVFEELDPKEMICRETPADLGIFDCRYVPAVLRLGNHYFCFFSNVILVFDAVGTFATAIDPTAVKLQIEKVRVDARAVSNISNSYWCIDTDSKYVEGGTTQHCSFDQGSGHRDDVYEYGEIKFSVLENTVSFSLSSGNAVRLLERVRDEYIRKCNNRHDPIPEFLDLLNIISEEGDKNTAYIQNVYKRKRSRVNYFCVMD